uniref:uncharacterized protein LOC122598313 n=1 Tax=Erigeron canadensis TaxID=72917 RepID=UPI001CB8C74C|nr:uncharacterized protein LOC122598313 [Erigeron canadensis]
MSTRDECMEQLQHEHSLVLVDLLPHYPQYDEYNDVEEEEEEEEEDSYTNWNFCSQCNLCGREITLCQRYYYKCNHGSCNYFLHKWCRELPTTINHRSHHCLNGTLTSFLFDSHIFTMFDKIYHWTCDVCKTIHKPDEILYRCSKCYFYVDLMCAIAAIENQIIFNPGHPHPLVSSSYEPILKTCDACGIKHLGRLYNCTICFNFSIQSDCLFLSKKLVTQHTHPLILSYSFPHEHQEEEFTPSCRICNQGFPNETLWIYKCEKCRLYVHLDCAKSQGDKFNFDLQENAKNYEDNDHPNLLNLPFEDQSDSIVKHVFFKEGITFERKNQKQNINFHEHPLCLVTKPSSTLDASSCCHNPMKKIELLCDGCVRPVTSFPYFKCTATKDQGCNFVLHEWCTFLPPTKNHPGHRHTLNLLPKVPRRFLGLFHCDVCSFPCNGFAYGCQKCGYYIDIICAFMPEEITHEAHPNHLFLRVRSNMKIHCLACLEIDRRLFIYKCHSCDVYLDVGCALSLPKIITHKSDKHPMRLSYMPIADHKTEYFCEICEDKFDPKRWFYHCNVCVQSVHTACAPLILQNERDVYEWYKKGVYEFMNIKFGSFSNIRRHEHSMLFAQGIESDGSCRVCITRCKYQMILRCLECEYVIHYHCRNY